MLGDSICMRGNMRVKCHCYLFYSQRVRHWVGIELSRKSFPFSMDFLIQNDFEMNLGNSVLLTEEPVIPSGSQMVNTLPVTEVSIVEDGEIIEATSNVQDEFKPRRTCYVYDQRMLQHWPPFAPDDEDTHHPERPRRISTIYSLLKETLCLKRMQKIPTRPLERFEAMLVHSEDHWEKVEAIEREPLWIFEANANRHSLFSNG